MKTSRILLIAILAPTIAACSGNKSGNAESSEHIDLTPFTGNNAMTSAGTIDSLALEADFLTPEQGVAVLTGLSEIIKVEQAEGKKSKKLEYMRKFIDTYDILRDRSEDFTSEFENAARSAGIDFAALFAQYRDVLSSEADGTAIESGGLPTTQTTADTQSSDSTSTKKPAPTEEAPADSIN